MKITPSLPAGKIAGLLLLVFLSGCTTFTSVDDWPPNMPDKSIFVNAYNEQTAAHANSGNLHSHLVWIKRFYQGSVLYPLGWNRMTEMLLESLESPQYREEVSSRMHHLGLRICLEWAQPNAIRKIDSAAIATWGNSLKTAAEMKQQLTFIGKVEDDVDALLAGQLDTENISRERYYPREDGPDFDDFDDF